MTNKPVFTTELSEVEEAKTVVMAWLDRNQGADEPARFTALISGVRYGAMETQSHALRAVGQLTGAKPYSSKDFDDLRKCLINLQALRELIDEQVGTDKAK